jgi:hypothetical protein
MSASAVSRDGTLFPRLRLLRCEWERPTTFANSLHDNPVASLPARMASARCGARYRCGPGCPSPTRLAPGVSCVVRDVGCIVSAFPSRPALRALTTSTVLPQFGRAVTISPTSPCALALNDAWGFSTALLPSATAHGHHRYLLLEGAAPDNRIGSNTERRERQMEGRFIWQLGILHFKTD